jgi:sensor c-di-GMP phosphodiesterase-like protein
MAALAWSGIGSYAQRAQKDEASRLASLVLTEAERDLSAVQLLFEELSQLRLQTCSLEQVHAMNQLDFDSSEVREMGVLDDQGALACSSRAGTAYAGAPVPVVLDLENQSAASMPRVDTGLTVPPSVTVRFGRLYALVDAARWVRFPIAQRWGFSMRVIDRSSGRVLAQNTDFSPARREASAEGLHLLVEVSSSSAYAADRRRAGQRWALPLGAFMVLAALLTQWQLLRHLRTCQSRIKRLIGFRPQSVQLVYQPIISIDDSRIVGVEALLRLRGKKGELLSPQDVFEAVDSLPAHAQWLTQLILKRALEEMAWWLKEDANRYLAVNLTLHDVEGAQFVPFARRELLAYGVRPSQLHVELLETSKFTTALAMRGLREMRDAGFELWIDDFGVGYSNLARLHTLPVHGVKLDREWVDSLDDTQVARTDAVTHLVLLAGSNGLNVIAEGVSDDVAMMTLLRLGVQTMQGFLFSPGIGAEDFRDLVDSAFGGEQPVYLREAVEGARNA